MFSAYDIQRSPFIRITIPFIIGIVLFLLFPAESGPAFISIYIIFLVCFILLYLIPYYRNKYSFSLYHSVSVIIILTFTGYYYTSTFNSIPDHQHGDKNGFITGIIVSDPQFKEKSVKLEVELSAIKTGNQWEKTEGKVLLYIEKNNNLKNAEIGDRIIFEPVLQDVRNSGNPREFDYKKYLAYNLIFQQAYLKSQQYTIIKAQDIFNLKRAAGQIRKEVISLLERSGIKGEELAVASALSIGYADDLDSEIKQSYSSTGAMHILSVSGLHVGIIFVVFSFILSFMNRKPWLRFVKAALLILILWFYALLSGLSPPISRAALMFSFIVIGQVTGRYTNIYNTLAASAFILLLINPFYIANIGFQFSYLAVLGIVFFYPKIYGVIYVKNKLIDKIWSLIAVSIAAQLITAPISIYYFHQFPNYFLLTNILVIPVSTVVIYLVILIVAFSWWPLALTSIGFLAEKTTYLLNHIIFNIEALPGAVTKEIPLNLTGTIILYIILFSFTFYILYKKFIPIAVSMTSFALLLALSFFNYINTVNEKEICIYNIDKHLAMNLIDGQKNYLFTSLDKDNKSYNYILKNNWIQKGLDEEKTIPLKKLNNQFILSNLFYLDNPNVFYKDNCFAFHNIRFALIRDDIENPKINGDPLPIDFVILSQNARVSIIDLLRIYKTDTLIIDPSNSNYRAKKWKEEAEKAGIFVYDISEKGAFYMKIS